MAINKDDPAKFDMYRCEVASGALTLDTENPGDVLGWGTEDESFEVRMRMAHALHTHRRRRARALLSTPY